MVLSFVVLINKKYTEIESIMQNNYKMFNDIQKSMAKYFINKIFSNEKQNNAPKSWFRGCLLSLISSLNNEVAGI